jgi:hypothetical protein
MQTVALGLHQQQQDFALIRVKKVHIYGIP